MNQKSKKLILSGCSIRTVPEVIDMLKRTGFIHIKTCQTIFKNPDEITEPEPVEDGFGKGGFSVLSSEKAP